MVKVSFDCKRKFTTMETTAFVVFRSEGKWGESSMASNEVSADKLEMILSTAVTLGVESPLNSTAD